MVSWQVQVLTQINRTLHMLRAQLQQTPVMDFFAAFVIPNPGMPIENLRTPISSGLHQLTSVRLWYRTAPCYSTSSNLGQPPALTPANSLSTSSACGPISVNMLHLSLTSVMVTWSAGNMNLSSRCSSCCFMFGEVMSMTLLSSTRAVARSRQRAVDVTNT